MIEFIGEHKPYDNGKYQLIPTEEFTEKKVSDQYGNIKNCIPCNVSLFGYSKVVHWSRIVNCINAIPRFYCIYPYEKSEINELIFMRDKLSRDFKDNYKYYEQGDLIAFKDGLYQFVDPLLGILPITSTCLSDEIIEQIYRG